MLMVFSLIVFHERLSKLARKGVPERKLNSGVQRGSSSPRTCIEHMQNGKNCLSWPTYQNNSLFVLKKVDNKKYVPSSVLLVLAEEYKPSDRSELLILQYLVRKEHAKRLKAARIRNKVRWLSTSMDDRMDCIVVSTYAEYYMCRKGLKIKVNEAITKCIQVVRSKVCCMVPFGKDLFPLIKGLGKDKMHTSIASSDGIQLLYYSFELTMISTVLITVAVLTVRDQRQANSVDAIY
ncbi:hypothetical protein FRACYDRAFT_235503 [Fragilariopsis cylindrus CCMP1102]|uniref:Uncharacterized protein n=1 Tax=Fragilariopsis cylindrus CCMP1102 TaxID=635003 RepID=A0A1E7FMP6_9STRA|nr:hypothetical protein FRACYDRAFT_235503 [Fragilariopsis cylindrus CCMP1102]|eukprot:OEU19449.1 hypothetical protein FRACYDRAFT_235503 [Fragilariopsis cylindrus CCMP1102]